MKRLLTSTALPIVFGALYFGVPVTAHAALVTDIFCGPSAGNGCENGTEAMIFLQGDKDVLFGFGNIGSQKGVPLIKITSDGGLLNMFIDLSNGFATITPSGPPNKQTTFNGIDITIPGDAAHPFGYGFTGLVFDTQLTPTGVTLDTFTADGFSGAHVLDLPVGNGTDKADQDAEYSLRAVGGFFDEIDIKALTGFDEIKHLEISGVCAFTTAARDTCTPVIIETPEPASLALLGVGLLGLGFITQRHARR